MSLNLSNYHSVATEITNLLTENNLPHEVFEHEPVLTSEQAAKIRPDYTLSQGAKALIIKYKSRNGNEGFAQLVVPGNVRYDSKKVDELLTAKKHRFATPEEIDKLTNGIKIGGVPPFGNLFNLPVYLDKSLLNEDKIIFNAGDRSISVAMNTHDYRNLVNPKVVSIV